MLVPQFSAMKQTEIEYSLQMNYQRSLEIKKDSEYCILHFLFIDYEFIFIQTITFIDIVLVQILQGEDLRKCVQYNMVW